MVILLQISEKFLLQRRTARLVHRRGTRQGIGNPQHVIFVFAQFVIGQQFHFVYVRQRIDISAQRTQMVGAVGASGDDHMSHPHRRAALADRLDKTQRLVHRLAGQVLIGRRVMVLDIVEHQVGVFEDVCITTLPHARSVDAGVDAGLAA